MKRVQILLIFLIGCITAVNADEPCVNIKEGLRYIEERTRISKPSYFYGYVIDGTANVAGKDALEVWWWDIENNEKTNLLAYLYVDGTKVYCRGRRNTAYENTWFLLYDFGLKAGEIMEGYVFRTDEPMKYLYRCEEIIENPKYNGLWTMTMSVADPESAFLEFQPAASWIVGIGSTADLLCPTEAFWINDSASNLVEVSDGDDILFSFLGNVSVEEAPLDSSGKKAVYDLNGSKLPMSPDALQPGVYVVRDGGATRKIMVK